MLAGAKGGPRVLVVQMIGRGDVHDIDARVVEHRLEAAIGLGQANLCRPRGGPLARGSDHAMHLHAQTAQRFDVDGADKPGPHHSRPDFGERPHRYQFRFELPSRADGPSFGWLAPPHHATQLAMTRWISGW